MQHMRRIYSSWRIPAVTLVVACSLGATAVALLSQRNYLSGSRMTSASANLAMSKQEHGEFVNSLTGFNFTGLDPDGNYDNSALHNLFFKNNGTQRLNVAVSFNPARLSNPNNVDLDHVWLTILNPRTDYTYQVRLSQLANAFQMGEGYGFDILLEPGASDRALFGMKLDSQAGATSLDSVSLENIDLEFMGW